MRLQIGRRKIGKRIALYSTTLLFAFVLPALSISIQKAQAQQKYPVRAIDFIVPTNAGGFADVNARIVAEFLKKKWRVPINVINKPGGSSVIGNLEVYQASPDGYTMLAVPNLAEHRQRSQENNRQNSRAGWKK